MKTSDKRLRRARCTLRNISDYCALQKAMAHAGVISPHMTWQRVYEDVNDMLSKWCEESLKESGHKNRSEWKAARALREAFDMVKK